MSTGRFTAPEGWGDPDPIPIDIAEDLAELFGLEQIVILGRKTGEAGSGAEHLLTWGKSDEHSAAADQIGQFLREKVMGHEASEGEIMRDRVRIARLAPRMAAALRLCHRDIFPSEENKNLKMVLAGVADDTLAELEAIIQEIEPEKKPRAEPDPNLLTRVREAWEKSVHLKSQGKRGKECAVDLTDITLDEARAALDAMGDWEDEQGGLMLLDNPRQIYDLHIRPKGASYEQEGYLLVRYG